MIPEFGMDISGLDAVIRQFTALGDRLEQALKAGLYEAAGEIMDKSQELVPVDQGILRASGFVDLPRNEDGQVVVQMGYGGPAGRGNRNGQTNSEDVGYAWIQHERLDFNHTVGQAKYLEAPAAALIPEIPQIVAGVMKEKLNGNA